MQTLCNGALNVMHRESFTALGGIRKSLAH